MWAALEITEPITTLTDYLLAGSAAFFGARLLLDRALRKRTAVLFWAGAFFVTMLGALAGGTYHGFALQLSATAQAVLWKAALVAAGLASALFLAGAAEGSLESPWRQRWVGLALGKFLIFAAVIAQREEFRFVVFDSAASLAGLFLLQGWAWWRKKASSAPWVLAGVLVAVVAGEVQRSGIVLHAHLNYNDLYHLLLIGAYYLFYRGGRRLGVRGS